MVKSLIGLGAKVDAADENGQTSLLLAAENGHMDTVKALVELEADINASNKHGRSALMIASKSGNTEMVKSLIELGAQVQASDNSKSPSCLHRNMDMKILLSFLFK
jgi:uncharacterized protein